ncbi:hypothetical protein HMI56_004044 [Coelomomyces lativittatus]|nr:hypothetical protein HMI56_004044 [Coelomomyces lativittatus]
MWVAPFAMLVIWLTTHLILYLVDFIYPKTKKRKEAHLSGVSRQGDITTLHMEPTLEKRPEGRGLIKRFKRPVKAARFNFILLATTAIITALGYGPSGGVIALQWIMFATGVLWVISEYFLYSPLLRELYILVIFPLIVITWGLAFRSSGIYTP